MRRHFLDETSFSSEIRAESFSFFGDSTEIHVNLTILAYQIKEDD
jgi:hypothetical protein